jgi:hypothetical protein
MKYLKFERIDSGISKDTIIRVTYKTWYGALRVRDVANRYGSSLWFFLDNGDLVLSYKPVETFHYSGKDSYIVNGTK